MNKKNNYISNNCSGCVDYECPIRDDVRAKYCNNYKHAARGCTVYMGYNFLKDSPCKFCIHDYCKDLEGNPINFESKSCKNCSNKNDNNTCEINWEKDGDSLKHKRIKDNDYCNWGWSRKSEGDNDE